MLQRTALLIYLLTLVPFLHNTLYAASLCRLESPCGLGGPYGLEGSCGLEASPDYDEAPTITLRERNDKRWALLVEAYPGRHDELIHRYEIYQSVAFRPLNNNLLYEKARECWLIATSVAMRNSAAKSPHMEP